MYYMNKTADRYFDLAFNYHISAVILYTNLFESPYLYNPTAFLLRHCVELLLKGLIIRETQKARRIAATRIAIYNRKLNNIHSPLELWNYFKDIYSLSEEDMEILDKAIKKLNKKDEISTRYRYPYKKNGRAVPIEPVTFDVSDTFPDLADGIPYIIQTSSETKIITKGSSLLLDMKALFDAVEILFKISEQS